MRVRARSSSSPRTTSSGSGSPTPALCERTRASCICSRSARPTWVSASAPKPVVMPYITLSCSTASATTARLGAIRAGTPSPITASAWPRATATRSSRSRASPVTVTVRMAGNLVGPAASRTGLPAAQRPALVAARPIGYGLSRTTGWPAGCSDVARTWLSW